MNNLKKTLQGYDQLFSSGELGKINDIKLDLTNKPISTIKNRVSRTIFGEATANAELVTRQYLLTMFANLDLNKQLLSSFASPEDEIVLVLPKIWRKMIVGHGIRVSSVRSTIVWNYFIFKFLLSKALILCRTIYDCLLQFIGIRKLRPTIIHGKYAYFFSLTKYALPQPDKEGISHDLISWYIDWKGRNKGVKTIYHNVKESDKMEFKGMEVDFLDHPFIPFNTKKGLFYYGCWCSKALFVSFLNFMIGRWWNVLLLEEAMQGAIIKLQKPELLAEEYYFNNSGWIYKPLWTYEAEKKGAVVHFYFYSTNCETFTWPNREKDFLYGYQAMNWPHYIVWNNYQARFVRNAVGDEGIISVVGSVWFASSSKELPFFPNKTIAVFDVQPMRDAIYKTLGLPFEYYIPEYCNKFLSDIREVCTTLNVTMALKRKREIGNKVHPSYRKYVKSIENCENFLTIDPSISASKIIESACIVISMPFSSTANLARELGRPSVFYDPSNLLRKDDHAAHGTLIISDIEELRAWISSHLVHQNHI